MLNMQAFHKLLSSVSEKKDSYLEALSAITSINPGDLSVLGSDLDWGDWGPEKIELIKA